jgi:septal ring factor EnvC (AmiA/AmiB activator)
LRHPNDNGFAERRSAAADAKRQLLAKFASAPKPTDPEMQEKLAARQAVGVAREARRAEREALKAAERERELAEAAAVAAAAEAEEKAEAEARQAASSRTRQPARPSATVAMRPARLVNPDPLTSCVDHDAATARGGLLGEQHGPTQ